MPDHGRQDAQEDLRPWSDPRYAVSVALPASWVRTPDLPVGVAVIAHEPPPPVPGFAASVVLTVDLLADDADVRRWQRGSEEHLGRVLERYTLVDVEEAVVAGRAGIRRLAHHVVDGTSVSMVQWAFVEAAAGYTLTGTSSTLVHHLLVGGFEQVADTLRVVGTASPAGEPR